MQTTEQRFLTSEHEDIFNQTKHIPGWQEPGDSFKLYDMAYTAGEVILEIGTFGGRSAVVELRGALANSHRDGSPQFYGVEIDIHGIWRTFNSLKEAGLEQYALLFHGDLEAFVKDFSIRPTMVFVDGDHRYEGVKRDLYILAKILSPQTPVLCHDYMNPENDTGILGVRQAVNEFVQEGYAELVGTFGCSAFLIMSEQCQGQSTERLSTEEFLARKAAVLEEMGLKLYRYWQHQKPKQPAPTPAENPVSVDHSAPDASADMVELRQKLQSRQKRVKALKHEVENLEQALGESRSRIEAMESSKFWKLRSLWIKCKETLLPGFVDQ